VKSVEDHAGLEYWDSNWQRQSLPALWDINGQSLGRYVEKAMFAYFAHALAGKKQQNVNKSLVEVGSACSAVLPLFNTELGYSITGIDYSPAGCAQTRAILAREGVTGAVVEADVFSPPPELLESFDAVVSIGLVEHFSDTGAIIEALAALLKPGGVMITSVPNMNGSVGLAQKVLDSAVYEIHVPLTRERLRSAHVSAGLMVEHCDYFLPSNFGVCNLNKTSVRTWYGGLKKVCLAALCRLSMISWWLEQRFGRLPTSRLFSPYVNCLSVKPN